jgi:hypothetical protein
MSTEIESLELKISSNSTEAANGIDALAESLKKLRDATKGSLGLSGVSKETEKLANTTAKVKAANDKASVSFTDLYHKMKVAATGLKTVGKAIFSAIGKSSDYVENVNLFTVSMGEYAGEAKEYAETVGEAMGIDPGEWMRNQGVFMTLATGFGVAGDRAAVMSKNLTQLGYDLSSFFNISYEDAMQKLQSGLSGELEPLRRIGYDLSQAKLEATALELGIDKTVSSMTQAEKAQLRYYAIMTQVTTAQGDMARTLDAPANQLKVFKAQVNMAGREIGNIFIPALNAILPYAIAVTKIIRILASNIANLFGFEMPEVDYSGVESMGNIAEDTSGALDDAAASAKKLKSYMLGFDELNVINPDTGGSTENESPLGEFDFELPEYDFMKGLSESKVAAIVEEMKEWLGITDDITSWSDLLTTNLGNILVTVGLIGVGIAAWNIASVVTDAEKLAKVLLTLKNTLNLMGIALKAMGATAVIAAATAGAIWLFQNTEDTITKIGAVVSAASLAVGAILAFTGINLPLGIALMAVGAVSMGTAIALNTNTLSDEVKGVIAIIASAVSVALLAVGAILAFTGVNIPLGIALMAGGALTMGTAVIPQWNGLSDSVKDTISTILAIVGGALLVIGAILVFTGVGIPLGIGLILAGAASLGTSVALNWNYLTDKIADICSAIAGFFVNLWNDIVGFFVNLWNDIVAIWKGVATWFDESVIQPVVAFFKGLWENVSGFFVDLWNGIKGVWNTVSTWFDENVIQPIASFFEGVTLRIGEFFEGCWLIIRAVWLIVSTWFNENVIQPTVNFFKGLWEDVSSFFTSLWEDIKAIWDLVSTWFNENVIQPVVGFFKGAWENILSFFKNLWNGIKGVWNTVSTWFDEKVIQPITGFFKGVWEEVSRFFSSLVADIKNVWSTVSNWFNTKIVTPVKTVFKNACDAIKDFFSSLWLSVKKGAVGAMNGVIGGIESALNWIIGGINKLIGGFDKIVQWAADVLGEDWKGMTLVKEVKFSRIPVPTYAEGGFPEMGQMFIAREAGAEMVGNIGRRTAVANNDQIISGIAGGVAEANEEQNVLLREQNSLLRAILEKDSGVYLDGKNLTNSVEKYQRERGRVLIAGGVV